MPGDFYTSTTNYADQVFYNGQMQFQSRWPNTNPADISNPTKSTITEFISKTKTTDKWNVVVFKDSNLNPKTDHFYDGAEIYVQPSSPESWSWTLSGEVVSQVGDQITMRTRNYCGQDGNGDIYSVGARYYLYNKKGLIDAEGEWYHDKDNNTLYMQVVNGETPEGKVEARCRDYAFKLDNKAHITIVRNRTIRMYNYNRYFTWW